MSQETGGITLKPKGPSEEIIVTMRRTWSGDLRTVLMIAFGGTLAGVLCKLIF
jgi:hypothetical protein